MRLIHFLRGGVSGVVGLLGISLCFVITRSYGAPPSGTSPSAVTAEPNEPKQSYNLPRGDAATMLRQFATVSKVPFLFMMDKVQGEQTNAVNGEFSPGDALALMLAGTSLEFIRDEATHGFVVSRRQATEQRAEVGQGIDHQPQTKMRHSKVVAFILALLGSASVPNMPAQAVPDQASQQEKQGVATGQTTDQRENEVVALSPFTVTASANTGYGAQMSTSGRLAEPYIDTPQAASVVTSELLQDAKLFDSTRALYYVPSVQINNGILPTQSIRGIATGYTYTDGFRNTPMTSFDTFFSDRIEVVKGPSSSSFGRGDPAGFINYVSKRPLFKDETEIGFLFGTGNDETHTYRGMVDQNGFLSKDHQTAYRFVTMYNQGAETLQYSNYQKSGVQLAVAQNLKQDKGRLDVVASYTSTTQPENNTEFDLKSKVLQNFYDVVLPVFGFTNVPTYLLPNGDSVLGNDRYKATQNVFRMTAILDYKLSEHWRTRQAGNIMSTDVNGAMGQYGIYSVDQAPDGTWMANSSALVMLFQEHKRSWQSDLLGTYDLDRIGAKLTLLAGADINSGSYVNGFADTGTATIAQPIVPWNPHLPLGPFLEEPAEKALETKGSDWSTYAQAKVKLWHDRVQLSAAGRILWQDQETINRRSGDVSTNKSQSPVQPAYSLLIKPQEWLSIYVNKSEYIEPASVTPRFFNAGPDAFPPNDPRRSETLTIQPKTDLDEFGAKATFYEGRLTFALDYFKEKQTGSLGGGVAHSYTSSTSGTGFYSENVLGTSQTSGWEFEGFGQVSKHLNFMFGGLLNAHGTQTGVWNENLVSGPVAQIGDSIYGYATYNFGENRYNGLSITAGWKTYFSGWYIGFTLVSGADSLKFPDTQNTFDFGLSYGFKGRYEVFVQGTNLSHKTAMPSFAAGPIGGGRQVFAGINARF